MCCTRAIYFSTWWTDCYSPKYRYHTERTKATKSGDKWRTTLATFLEMILLKFRAAGQLTSARKWRYNGLQVHESHVGIHSRSRFMEPISQCSRYQGYFSWPHSPFSSKWEWFPPEIHQPALIPPSLCRQKKKTLLGTGYHPKHKTQFWIASSNIKLYIL
jgi:hypothetical protein